MLPWKQEPNQKSSAAIAKGVIHKISYISNQSLMFTWINDVNGGLQM